jgi:hypothetical protein
MPALAFEHELDQGILGAHHLPVKQSTYQPYSRTKCSTVDMDPLMSFMSFSTAGSRAGGLSGCRLQAAPGPQTAGHWPYCIARRCHHAGGKRHLLDMDSLRQIMCRYALLVGSKNSLPITQKRTIVSG